MAFTVAELDNVLALVRKQLLPLAGGGPAPAPSTPKKMPPAHDEAQAVANAEAGFNLWGDGVTGEAILADLRAGLEDYKNKVTRPLNIQDNFVTYMRLTQATEFSAPPALTVANDIRGYAQPFTLQKHLDATWKNDGKPSGG